MNGTSRKTKNRYKHKISLSAGIPVFDDPYRLEAYDGRGACGEDRFITIGMGKNWIRFMSVTQ